MATLTTRALGYTLIVRTRGGAGQWELLDGERLVAFSEDWLRVDRAICAGMETVGDLSLDVLVEAHFPDIEEDAPDFGE